MASLSTEVTSSSSHLRTQNHGADDEKGYYISISGEILHSRYKVIRMLDEGSSANVVECWDMDKWEYVAIKIYKNSVKAKRVMDEVEFLRYLANTDKIGTYCVQLRNVFEYSNHFCVVYEKLGPSLYYLLLHSEYKSVSFAVRRELARQLLECVCFMHDNLVVHADLKPENILFASADTVEFIIDKDASVDTMDFPTRAIKLIDFGCSTFDFNDRTVEGRGTAPYCSPENLLGVGWNSPSDMWSYGCLLYEIVCGHTIFQTDHLFEQLTIIQKFLGPIPEYMLDKYISVSGKKQFKRTLACWAELAQRPIVEYVKTLSTLEDLIVEYAHEIVYSDFYNLLQGLLKYEPSERLTAREALAHPFMTKDCNIYW